ncbi:uncharacterized protein LOC144421055 [Styela clava]
MIFIFIGLIILTSVNIHIVECKWITKGGDTLYASDIFNDTKWTFSIISNREQILVFNVTKKKSFCPGNFTISPNQRNNHTFSPACNNVTPTCGIFYQTCKNANEENLVPQYKDCQIIEAHVYAVAKFVFDPDSARNFEMTYKYENCTSVFDGNLSQYAKMSLTTIETETQTTGIHVVVINTSASSYENATLTTEFHTVFEHNEKSHLFPIATIVSISIIVSLLIAAIVTFTIRKRMKNNRRATETHVYEDGRVKENEAPGQSIYEFALNPHTPEQTIEAIAQSNEENTDNLQVLTTDKGQVNDSSAFGMVDNVLYSMTV